MIELAFILSLAPAPEPEPEPIAVPAADAPSEAPVPAPEQVQAEAESGQGPVPPPEQVQAEAEAGRGPVPPPDKVASPPNPKAPPSEGVYAVGSSGVAPLPAAPSPVPPSAIRRGSWRGIGWLSVRLLVTGPIYGDAPGRPTVIALGGGADGGWRIRQWVALGAAFSRQPHEVYREDVPDAPAVVNRRGYMTAWDVAFLRLYAPVRGRVDPYLDIGGGLAFFDPARDRPSLLGGTVRASAGLEVWVSRHLTLGLSGLYRVNFVDETIGHAWQAGLDFGIHW
jgi:hypothetical protein